MTSNTSFWLMILSAAVVVAILFLVPVLIELRRTAKALTSVLKIAEESLAPTLRELRSTIENLDRITGDISTVTDDVRVFSGSIRQVGRDVQELSSLIGSLGGGIGAKIAGLRAGIGTSVTYLARNLFRKGDQP